MSLTTPDDRVTRLALAAKGGDRTAATEFIRLTSRDVQRFLTHLGHARDVEDLSQETYLRAMRALSTYAGRASARTWLLAIARRAAADHVRANMRRPRTVSYAGGEPLEAGDREQGVLPCFDEEVALQRLLADLEAQRREAFVATQVLGLSYQEAAAVCGCPVGTIRSRVSRAREDLIAAMRADGIPSRPLRAVV